MSKTTVDLRRICTLTLFIILLMSFVFQAMAAPPLKVTVVQPNGGENWGVGSQQLITWSYSKTPQTPVDVSLSYSTSGKRGAYTLIDQVIDPDGATTSYSWTVPDTPSDDCYVKVEIQDAGGKTASDKSDGAFSIGGEPQPPSLWVDPPSIVDRKMRPGKSFTVSIKTDYAGDDVVSYQFTLGYDPNVIHGTEVTNGDLIVGGSANFKAGTFNNTVGKLFLTVGFFFNEGEWTSGPGTLASVTFSVVAKGSSSITLGNETKLYGWDIWEWKEYLIIDAETMPDQIHHGFFSNDGTPAPSGSTQGKGFFDGQTAGSNVQTDTSSPVLYISIPDISVSWTYAGPYAVPEGVSNPTYYPPAYQWPSSAKPADRFDLHCAIFYSIKEELAKIGIDVEYYGPSTQEWMQMISSENYKLTWEEKWGTWPTEKHGWDMALIDFQTTPIELIGYQSKFSDGSQPPDGLNYFDWQNDKATELLDRFMNNSDPAKRKAYIDLWQDEFMHDPPLIPICYLETWDVTNENLEGWDPVVGWRDGWDLSVQGTVPSDDVIVRWGSIDFPPLVNLNPMFSVSPADFTYAEQAFETLLKIEKYYPEPDVVDYRLVPWLADSYPIYSQDGREVTVHLREGVLWQQHPQWGSTYHLGQYDVYETFRILMNFNYGDYADIIDWVETPIDDEYKVVFHLKEPYPAFDALLSQTYILPSYVLLDLETRHPDYNWFDWQGDQFNTNTDWRIPGTGAYNLTHRDLGGWQLEANINYWKWTSDPMVDRVDCSYISGGVAGWTALKTHEIDFGDVWEVSGIEMQEVIDGMKPGLKDVPDRTPTMIYLAFNLNNRMLSNRYVRQAFAHAINYPHIQDTIVDIGMGVNPYIALEPKTPVFPIQHYTSPDDQTVYFFNEVLPIYEYNIPVAQQYLNMWLYSQEYSNYELGPVGDGDFSGYVDLDDFSIWAFHVGQKPEDLPWLPGKDIDSDYDNTGYVEMADFYRWRENTGEYYPFYGAR